MRLPFRRVFYVVSRFAFSPKDRAIKSCESVQKDSFDMGRIMTATFQLRAQNGIIAGNCMAAASHCKLRSGALSLQVYRTTSVWFIACGTATFDDVYKSGEKNRAKTSSPVWILLYNTTNYLFNNIRKQIPVSDYLHRKSETSSYCSDHGLPRHSDLVRCPSRKSPLQQTLR